MFRTHNKNEKLRLPTYLSPGGRRITGSVIFIIVQTQRCLPGPSLQKIMALLDQNIVKFLIMAAILYNKTVLPNERTNFLNLFPPLFRGKLVQI